jgi:polar amino acid transport system substrate-binding protein
MGTARFRCGRPLVSAGVIAAAATLAACSSSSGSTSSGASSGAASLGLIQAGVIQSAVTAGDAPLATVTKSGQPQGFLVDLDNLIAKNLGVTITFKTTTTAAALAGLTAHHYDLLSFGLSTTPQRQQEVAFSKPIYSSSNSVMVRAGSSVSSPAGLDGQRVGASLGSAQYTFAKTSLPKAILVAEQLNSTAAEQLQSGQLDAIVVTNTEAGILITQTQGKYKVAYSVPEDTSSAVAIAKQETGLQSAYAAQLAKLVSNGTYLKLYDKWIAPLGMPFPAKLYAAWPALRAQVAKDPKANPSAPAGG